MKKEEKAEKADSEVAEPNEDEKKQQQDKKEKKKPNIKVDIEGIKDRIAALPIAVSSYYNLRSVGDYVYYNRKGSEDNNTQLRMYNLKERKETELGQFRGYEISADEKKMLVASGGKFAILNLPKSRIEMKETLDLSDMEVHLDKKKQWRQIFNECWRQMREFFYVPNMHGVDWEAMRKRYESLVAHVNHRADLTYIIGEMIGELNVGHTYVGGGEYPKPKRIAIGLLGAEIGRDGKSGYYRIKKILHGQNWDKLSVRR